MKFFFLFFLFVLTTIALAGQQTKIHVQNGVFIDQNGDCFLAFGYNYGGSNALIEDNWLSAPIWASMESDFQEMKGYGANTVRIHLQYNKFMNGVNDFNEVAFDRLDQLVQVAESKRMYLLITGLGAYRAADQPAWYDLLNEPQRWATQALFWGKVAETVGGSKAVFSYDLMNEPVVGDTTTWLPGPPYGGYQYVQNLTRNPNGRSYAQIVKAWILQMKNAIRTYDPVTPITVGFIGCGAIKPLSTDLDYISTHIYPQPDTDPPSLCNFNLTNAISFVYNNQDNKPFVISEIAPLNSFSATEDFMTATCPAVNGWVNHYFGTPIEELSDTSLFDAFVKANIRFFKAKYSELHVCQNACGGDVACLEGCETDPDLIACYRFNGNLLNDESGFNHTLTNFGGLPATGKADLPGTAISLHAGNPAYLLAPDNQTTRLGFDRSFTIMASIYPEWVLNTTIWGYDDKDNLDGDAPAVRDVVRLGINNTGLFDGQIGSDSVFYFTFTYGRDNSTFLSPLEGISSKCFRFNRWYNISAVYDAGKDSSFLYVNGHLQDAIRNSLAVPWVNSGQFPMIGRNNALGSLYPGFFNGKIDYIKVFKRALLPNEIVSCATLEDTHICTVGLTEELPEQEVLVYPNPADNKLHLKLPASSGLVFVRIEDMAGNVRYDRKVYATQDLLTIEAQAFPDGFYIIKIMDDGGRQYSTKIIIVGR